MICRSCLLARAASRPQARPTYRLHDVIAPSNLSPSFQRSSTRASSSASQQIRSVSTFNSSSPASTLASGPAQICRDIQYSRMPQLQRRRQRKFQPRDLVLDGRPTTGSRRYSTKPDTLLDPDRVGANANDGQRLSTNVAVNEEAVGRAAAEEDLDPQSYVETNSAWNGLGIPANLIGQLALSYPQITHPTPAQRLFLLAVGADKEVFLKDEMGRGKTFALAVAALTLSLRMSPNELASPRTQIMILVPTPYLAHQIYDHLCRLSPPSSAESSPLFTFLRPRHSASDAPVTTTSSNLPLPDTPIVLSSAKDLEQYDLSTLSSLRYIFVDEPDTLVGSIPPRYYPTSQLPSHPLFRHPPPIVHILKTLLNIQSNRKDELDFSHRRDEINTIWTSATMTKDFRRVVKTRGWIRRGKGAVDLDFTSSASDRAREFRRRLLEAMPPPPAPSSSMPEHQDTVDVSSSSSESQPRHYGLVVDPADGGIASLVPGAASQPSVALTPHKADLQDDSTSTPNKQGSVTPFLLESLALLHATSPPPPGKYALALSPEGVSLSTVATDLSKLGIPSLILAPHLLQLDLKTTLEQMEAERDQAEAEENEEEGELSGSGGGGSGGDKVSPILLVQRSSIPGLHLQDLHTIYLIDGLDVGGLSKKQRKSGGVKDRFGFYDLVAGRLGRLGTSSIADKALLKSANNLSGSVSDAERVERALAEGVEDRQRVISIVMGGSEEEKRLGDMFVNGGTGVPGAGNEGGKVEQGKDRKLDQWDLETLYATLEREIGGGSDAGTGNGTGTGQ